ncbi:MAG: hypothetical protein V4691_10920 [Pseudomonadota bacterium]
MSDKYEFVLLPAFVKIDVDPNDKKDASSLSEFKKAIGANINYGEMTIKNGKTNLHFILKDEKFSQNRAEEIFKSINEKFDEDGDKDHISWKEYFACYKDSVPILENMIGEVKKKVDKKTDFFYLTKIT